MSEGNAAVEVTQADREAATGLWNYMRGQGPVIDSTEAGRALGQAFLQAFARHRLSATTSDETERLRESLEAICDHATVRIQDGIELGATVWRLALEDIVRDVTAALQSQDIPS